jgi:predicted nucleic acid-binding protein
VNLYLDASVLVPTLVAEQTSAAVDEFLRTNADDVIVSDFVAAAVRELGIDVVVPATQHGR